MWKELAPTIVEALAPLVGLLISLAVAWLTPWLKARLAAGTARDVALELALASETIVRHLEQSVRPLAAAAATDGKLTTEEATELKALAVRMLREQLSQQAQRLIQSNSGRLEEVLSRSIEAAHQKTKAGAS